MKIISIKVLALVFLSGISCRNIEEKENKLNVPAETRATIEYSHHQLDTIPENTSDIGVFRGSGGEPFWSVRVDSNSILFETPDKKITGTISNSDTSENATVFFSNYENGTMKVVIKKEECIDGMSGKKNSHKVEFQIKQKNGKDFTTYEGCGDYEEP